MCEHNCCGWIYSLVLSFQEAKTEQGNMTQLLILIIKNVALAGVAQWVECQPAN